MALMTARRMAYSASVFFLNVLLVFLLLIPHVSAESLLSLEDAIDIALEESFSMKSLRLNLIQSEQNHLATKYSLRTNADMTFNTPNWTESVSTVRVPNKLTVYNSYGSLNYQGNLDINQPLPTDGTITLRSQFNQAKRTTYLSDTNITLKGKDFRTSLSIHLQQPLFTYNRIKTNLKTTEINYERALRSFTRTELDVIYNVTQAFYSLYRETRTYVISSESLEQSKKSYDLASLKFTAGLIPEVQALQQEVVLAEAQAGFLASEASLESQKDQFKKLIGIDLGEDIGVKTDITYSHIDIDLDKAIEHGLANRSEIRERELDIELQHLSIMRTDARNEIRADLNVFYDLTGISNQELSYNTSARDLFDSSWEDLKRRPRNRGISLIFYVPIWDWGVNKAEITSALASLKISEMALEDEKKDVVNSIRSVVRQVKMAENRLKVLEKNQEVAQKSYDISLERFNNGEITSQELLIDSDRLTSAKMLYLNAYISYKLAVADLKRKTFWDFENDLPI